MIWNLAMYQPLGVSNEELAIRSRMLGDFTQILNIRELLSPPSLPVAQES